ncbi:long-chain-fatty-acid--CoA ligase [Acinetobacter silvestris]|uniref:Long-chain fatty acid--CoA ligase n=1 Tax=Acinetobacter silvestris TaxID=1977882 RepID=A0A1Y3CEX2_9GAMM|nr:long-chain-fatty-acid--CoA ligase [Acinetobacter silvestris]OTG65170.1 long-chain fatty acid--CoA ligase [Acinetobacter silvestris]
MYGQMMFKPLLISSLLEHAANFHADTAIISKNLDTSLHTTNWGEVSANAKRFAKALNALNVQHGDCVATLAWNNYRHVEAWYAISGSGLICHTINPRLFPEQLIFIVNDAKDRVLIFDKTFLPLILAIKTHISNVETFICLDAYDEDIKQALPEVQFYDDLVQQQTADYDWPEFDELTASSLCYTSGTTGHPKGVLYSHRSTVLHTLAACIPDSLNLSAQDVMLPVVPMFHVHAWGSPYAAAMVGCTLILPGPYLDGESLVKMIDDYQVTVALGVPTIWQGLISAAQKLGSQLCSMTRNVVGGSACPPSMIATFKQDYHCETIHAWGMTEASPLGTVNQLKAKHKDLSASEQAEIRLSQGRPPFGIQVRIVNQENDTTSIQQDVGAIGNLQIKGHWIVKHYFGASDALLTSDGWFDTGDIARLNSDGYLTISDRAKDLIKSGGEWISSVELENIAMGHPEVAMAAVIAAKHEKWDERPVLVAVKQPNSPITEMEILDYYHDKIAKWQIPDKVIFVDAIPLSGTGKMLKRKLREDFVNILLDS